MRPEWDGGNPRPQPPIHQKGVISFDGDAQARASPTCSGIFQATDQYPGDGAPPRRRPCAAAAG